MAVGVLLLFGNFLFLGEFTLTDLWPLLLVLLGAQILIRGDILPSVASRTFGITRGSVEAAMLEIHAGEIDVHLRCLDQKHNERLIAGQYASNSRPDLTVEGVYAHLKLDRARTSWLSFADWDMAISAELPWQVLATSHLGQIDLDLSEAIVQGALISTGFGDIHLTVPRESFEPVFIRSTLGHIHIHTPPGSQARIITHPGRFSRVQASETRYEMAEQNVYSARDAAPDSNAVEIHIRGQFGDVYLS